MQDMQFCKRKQPLSHVSHNSASGITAITFFYGCGGIAPQCWWVDLQRTMALHQVLALMQSYLTDQFIKLAFHPETFKSNPQLIELERGRSMENPPYMFRSPCSPSCSCSQSGHQILTSPPARSISVTFEYVVMGNHLPLLFPLLHGHVRQVY